MKSKCFILTVLVLLIALAQLQAQKVIPLYPGKAPGSENWTWKEQNLGGYLKDVTDPTLTAFVPSNPNGTAVIIAPGGGFHFLVYELEGTAVAKKLNEKGITVFVLKYRLVHEDPASISYYMKIMETKNFKMLDSVSAPVIRLALNDALTAMKYVRQHAAEYKIDANKIGFMGSSAGGTIAMSVAYNALEESRPNFVSAVYAYGNAIIGSKVPSARTPIFIACASDDELVPATHSVQIYSKWLEANQPVELHMYERGGHGFIMKKQNLPCDKWLERFTDWLSMQYP